MVLLLWREQVVLDEYQFVASVADCSTAWRDLTIQHDFSENRFPVFGIMP